MRYKATERLRPFIFNPPLTLHQKLTDFPADNFRSFGSWFSMHFNSLTTINLKTSSRPPKDRCSKGGKLFGAASNQALESASFWSQFHRPCYFFYYKQDLLVLI